MIRRIDYSSEVFYQLALVNQEYEDNLKYNSGDGRPDKQRWLKVWEDQTLSAILRYGFGKH